MNQWEKGVLWLTIGLTIAVLAKLWRIGLIRAYKWLFFYLAFDLISSIAGMSIPYHTSTYGYYYVVAQTLKLMIAAFVVVEIYSLALGHHQALARFGRDAVGYILAAAALIPLVVVALDHTDAGNRQLYFRAYLLFEQTMNATIAIFLILITVFMAWFPVRLRRNVIVYIAGFVVWTLARSAALRLVIQFHGNQSAIRAINSALLFVPVSCLVFWLVGLKKAGESRTAVVGHLWNRAEGERLAEQLEAINDSLERLRRK